MVNTPNSVLIRRLRRMGAEGLSENATNLEIAETLIELGHLYVAMDEAIASLGETDPDT